LVFRRNSKFFDRGFDGPPFRRSLQLHYLVRDGTAPKVQMDKRQAEYVVSWFEEGRKNEKSFATLEEARTFAEPLAMRPGVRGLHIERRETEGGKSGGDWRRSR